MTVAELRALLEQHDDDTRVAVSDGTMLYRDVDVETWTADEHNSSGAHFDRGERVVVIY